VLITAINQQPLYDAVMIARLIRECNIQVVETPPPLSPRVNTVPLELVGEIKGKLEMTPPIS